MIAKPDDGGAPRSGGVTTRRTPDPEDELRAKGKAIGFTPVAGIRPACDCSTPLKGGVKKTPSKAPARMGRPSGYTKQVGDTICRRLALGHTLRSICKHEGLAMSMVVRWLDIVPEFRVQYASSRAVGLDVMADEIITIADTCRTGKRTTTGPKGTEVVTADMVERARLMIDARKWLLSKLRPEQYGDRPAGGDSREVTVNVVYEQRVQPQPERPVITYEQQLKRVIPSV